MNWLLFSQFAIVALVSGGAGWLLANNMYAPRLELYWEELNDTAARELELRDRLDEFQTAATPIVASITKVGEIEEWRDAAETFREYEWYEIEPLAKCLKKLEER